MTNCTCDSAPAPDRHAAAVPARRAIAGTHRSLKQAVLFQPDQHTIDVFSGALHAELGLHYWLRGRWDLTALSFRLAREMSPAGGHALLAAVTPLLPTGRGDLRQADKQLRATTVDLATAEWEPALDYLLIAQVARLHADGSRKQRAGLFVEVRSRRRGAPIPAVTTSAPVLLHYGLAAIWADAAQVARAVASQLAALSLRVPWARGVAAWLKGLLAEAEGDLRGALEHLAAAGAAEALAELPLYRAHTLVDYARVAATVGATSQAQDSRSRARECYERLGAAGYLEKLDPRPTRAPGRQDLLALSAREREVLTLIVNGLSYAQIGRELFISTSTVGYHLSNIYAKTGVSSRHELTDSARRDPISLGLSA